MEQDQTVLEPTPAPKTPDKKQKKPPKKLTKEQRWWRFHGMQAGLFAGMGVVGGGILIALICLLTLPFRGSLTNSQAEASNIEPPESVQEPVAATPTPTPTPQASTVSLMAVGDNLIHSTVYEFAQQDDGSYDFTDIYTYIKDDLEEADIACIQQETILVNDPNRYANYPCFGTPAEMADSLASVGFDVVCQASNHTLDQGTTGIEDTLAAWKKHPEVTMLGIHGTQEEADKIAVVEKNGIKIAMLDYTYGLNEFVPEQDYYVDRMDADHKERVGRQLDEAKTLADITVVFMHDGTEDQFTPDEDQKTWAQFFADHGVGLVIGTHPHVVEPVDVITGESGNKMPIFYSLGNFVSSQKDNFNMLGGMAKVVITKDQTGTYVSDYNIEPLVNVIQSGGTHGMGYRFHVYHLEDYTQELQDSHIRDNCSKAALEGIWDEIFADASTGMNDKTHPLPAGTPVKRGSETEAAASPSPSAEGTPMVSPDAASPSPTANAA